MSLGKKTIKVDIEEFKKIFPDIKEILSTTETNPFLEKKVILSLALKEYNFNYDKFTFIKDDIVYLVDLDRYKAVALNRVPNNTTPNSPNGSLTPPIEPAQLDLKKDLNIDLDVNNVMEETIFKPLRDNLKEKYDVDYYDKNKK
ncbi:hypothetical protein [Campylobacter hominis]|nr:hypothetical protein [Campylobacter hominis]SUW84872.1 Uncharacterised protein [Campylobacter hominis]